MPKNDSVTQWLRGVKDGESAAINGLWERYFEQLVRLANKKLRGANLRAFCEEDVALSAFKSFWMGVRKGQFPDLHDRNNLWGILDIITARKARAWVKHHNRQKRGGGKVRGESVFPDQGDREAGGMNALLDVEPTPAFVAQCVEEYQRLLDLLDPRCREVALLKEQGFSVKEIVAKLEKTSERSVQRRLEIIRKTWQEELATDDQMG